MSTFIHGKAKRAGKLIKKAHPFFRETENIGILGQMDALRYFYVNRTKNWLLQILKPIIP